MPRPPRRLAGPGPGSGRHSAMVGVDAQLVEDFEILQLHQLISMLTGREVPRAEQEARPAPDPRLSHALEETLFPGLPAARRRGHRDGVR